VKKLVSLMFLLLAPHCARAMDAKCATGSEEETPLSPRTACLRDGSEILLRDMVQHEIAHLPDAQTIESEELVEVVIKALALKHLNRSLFGVWSQVKNSRWQEAQKLLSDQTKETFLKKIIQEIKESELDSE